MLQCLLKDSALHTVRLPGRKWGGAAATRSCGSAKKELQRGGGPVSSGRSLRSRAAVATPAQLLHLAGQRAAATRRCAEHALLVGAALGCPPYLLPELVRRVRPLDGLQVQVQAAALLLDGRIAAVGQRARRAVAQARDVVLVAAEVLRLRLDLEGAVVVVDYLRAARSRLVRLPKYTRCSVRPWRLSIRLTRPRRLLLAALLLFRR